MQNPFIKNEENKYDVTEEDAARMRKIFSYHPIVPGQEARYNEMRSLGNAMALTILGNCPPCEERETAIYKLGEAIMHANAAIARHE